MESSVAFIDIHILSNEVETVISIDGDCYWMDDSGARLSLVQLGESINKDDLIYAEAGAELRFSRGMIRGGHRGRVRRRRGRGGHQTRARDPGRTPGHATVVQQHASVVHEDVSRVRV